jgi:hypothetical protein
VLKDVMPSRVVTIDKAGKRLLIFGTLIGAPRNEEGDDFEMKRSRKEKRLLGADDSSVEMAR